MPGVFLSEGEQEEAWLAEAGLTRLFGDSLAADDQDQVSIIFPLCYSDVHLLLTMCKTID